MSRAVAAAAIAAVAAGCAPFASSGSDPATDDILLTTDGARTTLAGDPPSVFESVRETFRVLDIDLVRRNVDTEGGNVEGVAGNSRVFVDLTALEARRTTVEIRVRAGGSSRWDREAARGILHEVRRWQGS